jgi:putative redox protein
VLLPRKSYRVHFPGGNGSDLAGIIDRPDSVGVFPVAVFSHCFTCNKDLKAIVRMSRALAEMGIAVLRYDMTGLGGSQGDFSRTSFTTNVADLGSAIAFAQSQLGPVTALVGHSFGGAASLAVAGGMGGVLASVSSLRAVVALAAPSDTQHLAVLLTGKDRRILSEGSGSVNIGGRDWTIRREMIEDLRSHSLPDTISRIQIPTLLLHSPDDSTVSFDHALRIMGLIQASPYGGAPVSLLSLQGADHLLSQNQEDIDLVASSVAAFLRRYAQPLASSVPSDSLADSRNPS